MEVRIFKKSLYYHSIEEAYVNSEKLLTRPSDGKYDLDSEEGQEICRNYLKIIEQISLIYQIKPEDRSYREKFSKAYKVLYNDGELCYLTEILDSA